MVELNLIDYDLNSIKDILQEILKNHLPEKSQFSVQDFDEHGVTKIIELLLEKDNEKRELLWQEIENGYQTASNDFRNTYQKILEIHDQVQITEQLGSSLKELKANIKNNESLSELEQKI